MQRWFSAGGRLALGFGLALAVATAGAAPAAVSDAAREFAARVVAHDDHGRRPFAVVDKRAALLIVYRGDGSLAGTTPVLLGRTAGDLSAPGVGERAQHGALRRDDATTAAGRFASAPGRNRSGEAVVWLDHDAALAIHRLRPGATQRARQRALASPRSSERRVSDGCVVAPVAFFQDIVLPLLGSRRGVVYVLPEHRHWQQLWAEIAGDDH